MNIIHNLVMVVLRLVDIFKGMDIRWRRKRNVRSGSVANIREVSVCVVVSLSRML